MVVWGALGGMLKDSRRWLRTQSTPCAMDMADVLSRKLAEDRKNTSILEEYWVAHREKSGNGNRRLSGETPVSSPSLNSSPFPRKTHSRNRSASDGASLIPPGNKLSPYHPAWSLTSLLDKFGPLIFPIHRAALLRKRILISCHAPVHEVCDFGKSYPSS